MNSTQYVKLRAISNCGIRSMAWDIILGVS